MFGLGKNKKSDSAREAQPRLETKESQPRPFSKEPGQEKTASAALADGGLILRRPWVSERAMGWEVQGQYVFAVDPAATKPVVKQTVEKLFGVKVEKVNIVNMKPRTKVFRGRAGHQTGFKKAIVKLVRGHKIEVLPR